MMRSRLTSRVGRWALLVLLALGGGGAAAQSPAQSVPAPVTQPQTEAPATADSAVAPAPAAPAADWTWMLGLLVGGIALGVLGARLLGRKSQQAAVSSAPEPALPAEPVAKKRAENVPMSPKVQSMRQVQASKPIPSPKPQDVSKPSGSGGKSKHKPKHNPANQSVQDWSVPHRPAAMNPTQPPVPTPPADQPLETGQTIEWAAPTTTPPAIQEMIAASAPEAVAAPAENPTSASTGPVHYYAPAPDVPSIEHRKLSPNPLPQMPLLITLPQAEAAVAEFSFSPQADQSRIIGNGVRELKEFFQFELPPTEQFTTIKNLAPGKLEKRDDAWHVVQKASIALS